jgi:hypothetical protein
MLTTGSLAVTDTPGEALATTQPPNRFSLIRDRLLS